MQKLLIVANVSKEHIRKFHIPVIAYMKDHLWQVDVACRMDAPIPECDHAFDLPCDRNPFSGGITKSIRILKDILSKGSYDAILCNTVTGGLIGRIAAKSFRKNGLKVFYLNHGLHFFKGASLSRWAMGYPVEKAMAPLTDVLITINSADLEMAGKHLNIAALERIHGIGVNLNRFREYPLSDGDRALLRKSLGISPTDRVITYVAEIIDNKNQQMLLDMFRLVRQSDPDTKLLLVGPEHDGGLIRQLVNKSDLAGSVLMPGWREDIPALLKASDVYVASSKSEGLPINLIEAMACNLPVVASKNRGHCEIICHGVNGFLVEQNDSRDMASHVLRLLHDETLKAEIVKQACAGISQYEAGSVMKELYSILCKYTK